MMRPDTKYARSGDLSIAYQVFGEGPLDLVVVSGFISHLDLFWDNARVAALLERLASFARVILFDKRGVGLSDPVDGVPTLEERMDDVRAVMDAAGSQRAALMGISEGAPMCILFAATYPERTSALILYGGMARSVEDDDYPWAAPAEALLESNRDFIGPFWGQGTTIEIFAPSLADDPRARESQARIERQAASPSMVAQLFRMFLDIDVRHVLPLIQVPTLVLHRRGDRVVNVRAGRWMAEQIPNAKFVELQGIDHMIYAGDADAVIAEVQEFLTGVRPVPVHERILASVLFTDIAGSTRLASEMGDRRWRELLEAHGDLVRIELESFRGREVKTTGDGFLAVFDGPARAIRCAKAITENVVPLGIQVRAGLHTGECEVMGDDVGGIAVHVAARVCDIAEPSTVLVSRTVKDLVAGSGITFEDRGLHSLKGIPDEWGLFAVSSA